MPPSCRPGGGRWTSRGVWGEAETTHAQALGARHARVCVRALDGGREHPGRRQPREHYTGPYFGANNFPPGCIRDMSPTNPDNICYHMRTGLNALDSPKVDVLVMVPVSPTAERDMRIMRQSVEMWESGIDYLADQMGLNWLGAGMDFHITVDYVDLQGNNGGEFTTYPIVDPEIVVIATNPVGGVGIGVDPVPVVDHRREPGALPQHPEPVRLRVLGEPPGLQRSPPGADRNLRRGLRRRRRQHLLRDQRRDRPGARGDRLLQPLRPRFPRVRALPHPRSRG